MKLCCLISVAVALFLHGADVDPATQSDLLQQNVVGPATPSDCAIELDVRRIASQLHVASGVETVERCRRDQPIAKRPDVKGNAREAITRLAADVYRWRLSDGVLTVRPLSAIEDRNHFLNRPVTAFAIVGGDFGSAFRALGAGTAHRFPAPNDWLLRATPYLQPISVTFAGGTAVAALNSIVAGRADMSWAVRYCVPTHEAQSAKIILDTRDDLHQGRAGTAVVSTSADSECR